MKSLGLMPLVEVNELVEDEELEVLRFVLASKALMPSIVMGVALLGCRLSADAQADYRIQNLIHLHCAADQATSL